MLCEVFKTLDYFNHAGKPIEGPFQFPKRKWLGTVINYGSGGGGKLGGVHPKKNFNKERGLPKWFCLMRGHFEKKLTCFSVLFHQIILIKKINMFRLSCAHMNLPH